MANSNPSNFKVLIHSEDYLKRLELDTEPPTLKYLNKLHRMYAGDTVPPVMMIPCHYFHDIFKGNLVNFQPFSLMFFLSDSPSSSMR